MIQRVKTGVIADGAVTLAKLNDETENSFNFRNRVHNGDFRINQRGTSSRSNTVNNITDSEAGGRAMVADRWWTYVLAGATNGMNSSNCTIGIVNDHPVVASGNCYSITVNTNATTNANVVVANYTTDFALLTHGFEGLTVSDLFNTSSTTPMVLSFWVKSNKTGSYSVQIRPNGDNSGRTIVLPYTISSSGTWERKTLSVPVYNYGNVPNDVTKRIDMYFSLASNLKATHTDNQGSTITQAQIDACTNQWGPNYWGSGLVINDHVNLFQNTGNYFRLTDVQLEPGSAATTFERRPYATELQICQRYYERYRTNYSFTGKVPNSSYTSNLVFDWQFLVEKRATPTPSQISGTTVQLDRYGIGAINPTGTFLYGRSPTFAIIEFTLATGYTAGESMSLTGTYFQVSAEI